MFIHSNNLILKIKGKGMNIGLMVVKPAHALGATRATVI